MLRSLLASLLCVAPLFAGASNSLLDVSPDGKLLAVANTDNGTVTVVDLKSRKHLREFRCGPGRIVQRVGHAKVGDHVQASRQTIAAGDLH